MNTEETPHTGLQTSAEDGLGDCPIAETEKTSFQMASDLNENNLNGDQPLNRNTEISLHNRDAQDNNNNENGNLVCGQLNCRKSCEGDCTVVESSAPLSTKDSATGKHVARRRSNRNKKTPNGKSSGFLASADISVSEDKCVDSTHDMATLDSHVSPEHKNQKQLRDSLFSLIRDGCEQTDGRMLSMCLHQIAETYFQEEDYEKGMQFIQLERVYHEQLLANLSAIQEQWETKWKKTKSASLPSPSENDLSRQELEMLSNICGSHQEPQASIWQSSTSEKIQNLHQLKGSVGYDVDGECPARASGSGIKISASRKPGVAEMTEHSLPDGSTTGNLSMVADHQAVAGKSHTEGQQFITCGRSLESPTLSTGTGGRANPDGSFPSGDAGQNNNLLQPEATPRGNVSEIETLSKDRTEERADNPMVDKLITASVVHSDCSLETQDDCTEGSSSLECTSFIQTVHTVSSSEDGATTRIINTESQVGETGLCPIGSANQKCLEELNKSQRQATVEFIASLLNGDLKESENFLAHLDFQEETYSEEEMSPSPGESVLGDNLLSLDELGKRIEIEEVSPAAGLVSILKKRNGSDGENHKKTKRKVRFLETDDVLDQEEIGGGSCILLVALCLVTVFLSIGGTALYCTFADVESSICKDFTANMDFYYTQAVQGVEELKHWLFVT
ncbi:consortin [Bufo gargarizans]|uniref:consortin n=1 Tax=Bufo gargarizans TaxID=30331 RepID=UPI001CF22CDB|nr:consortin [Bufo gargarizans]XP_044147865.1 consortin [Bufo gargarizans]